MDTVVHHDLCSFWDIMLILEHCKPSEQGMPKHAEQLRKLTTNNQGVWVGVHCDNPICWHRGLDTNIDRLHCQLDCDDDVACVTPDDVPMHVRTFLQQLTVQQEHIYGLIIDHEQIMVITDFYVAPEIEAAITTLLSDLEAAVYEMLDDTAVFH